MTAALAGLAAWAVIMTALCGAAIAGSAAPQTVTLNVDLIDDRFVPDHLVFHAGVHYRLHLANRGKHLHEFTAPAFFAGAEVDNPDALNRERTEVVLQPGEDKDVFLTAPRPGSYDLRCADHDWEGMVGTIIVD